MVVHEKIRPFKCDICNLSFKLNKYLIKHKREVHDVKNSENGKITKRDFICEICKATFTIKPNLKRHIKAVHEEYKLNDDQINYI